MKRHVSRRRRLLEALESRLLLSSTLIPVTDHGDLIFDAARNRLYITTDTSTVRRYDLASQQFLAPWTVGTKVFAGDITPDDSALYLTEQSDFVIHRIDLATDAVTDLPYAPDPGDGGSNWLCITADNRAIFSNYGSTSDFHSIDLATNAISTVSRNTFADPTGYLFRGADRSLVAATGIYSDGPLVVYTTSTDAFSPPFNTLLDHQRTNEAVSRDGILIAIDQPLTGHQDILVENLQHQILASLPGTGAAFSPISDQLFVASDSSLTIYDTNTWAAIKTLDIGEMYSSSPNNFGNPSAPADLGLMRFSDDGSELFINTVSGIRIIDAPLHNWAASISVSALPAGTSAYEPVSLTAQVTTTDPQAGSAIPTGVVTFFDGGTPLGSAGVIGGVATLSFAGFTAGSHSLSASFDGGLNFAPASSAPLAANVEKTASATTLAIDGQTSLSVSLGLFLTYTSTVSAVVGPTPTGSVDILDSASGRMLASASLASGAISPGAALGLEAGTYSVRADYSGDANFAPSSSALVTLTVLPATPSISVHVDSVTGLLIANIWAVYGIGASGTVTFRDGTLVLGTGNVVANGAEFTGFHGQSGSYALTASYSGDRNYNAAVSAILTNPAFPPPPVNPTNPTSTSTNLSASATSMTLGQQLTLTATVSATSNADGPVHGTVYFFSDALPIGNTPVSSGKAVLTISSLGLGNHTLQAYFLPTSNHIASVGAVAGLTVTNATVIDILALWTLGRDDPNTITQQIEDSVANANTALANSLIPITARLVGMSAVPAGPEIPNNTSSHDLDRSLGYLTNPADGVWDNVPQLRATFGADVVVLFDTQNVLFTPGITVGLSNFLNPNNPQRSQSAYIAIDSREPASSYVLAHELGHTLGAAHAVDDPTPNGATAYAHGYRFTGNDGKTYHDIMAYDPGTMIPYYSNPNLTYAGVAIGDAATADASRTIREFAPSVAAYRPAPSPMGSIDIATGGLISGWADDPKAFASSISVRITIDGATRATLVAADQRTGLYGYLGSAAHGFSYIPTGLSAGNHTVSVYALDAASGAPILLGTRTITVTITPPMGFLDVANTTHIAGWTIDTDAPTAALSVSVSLDGTNVTTAPANLSRPGLTALYGSANHGFDIALPALAPGIHRLDVYADDTNTGRLTLLGSRTIDTDLPAIGWLDSVTATAISGWAIAGDHSATPIQIRYTIDNNPPVFATAAASRPGLVAAYGSADHGFSITLPALTDGTHTLRVDAVDPISKSLTLLGTRSIAISAATLIAGSLDIATNSRVAGWAVSRRSPNQPLQVRIDVDGVTGTPFAASLSRPGLAAIYGSANHAFDITLPTLAPGNHRLDLYALDPITSTPILIASKNTITALPTGFVDIFSATRIAGWAYAPALAAASMQIRIDVDNMIGAPVTASLPRPGLSYSGANTFGFDLNTANISAGSHKITIWLIDPTTDNLTLLSSKTLTFA